MAFSRGLCARALPSGRLRVLPTRTMAVRVLPRVRPWDRTLGPLRRQASYVLPVSRVGHVHPRLPEFPQSPDRIDERACRSSFRAPGVPGTRAPWWRAAPDLPDDHQSHRSMPRRRPRTHLALCGGTMGGRTDAGLLAAAPGPARTHAFRDQTPDKRDSAEVAFRHGSLSPVGARRRRVNRWFNSTKPSAPEHGQGEQAPWCAPLSATDRAPSPAARSLPELETAQLATGSSPRATPGSDCLGRLKQVDQATSIWRGVIDHASGVGQQLNQAGKSSKANLKRIEVLAGRADFR